MQREQPVEYAFYPYEVLVETIFQLGNVLSLERTASSNANSSALWADSADATVASADFSKSARAPVAVSRDCRLTNIPKETNKKVPVPKMSSNLIGNTAIKTAVAETIKKDKTMIVILKPLLNLNIIHLYFF